MYLTGAGNQPNALVTLLSPRLDEPDVLVKSTTPRYSPWRTIMIGTTPGALIESNMVLNLNDPCQIKDASWIKAGKCAWDRWWCGGYAPDFGGPVGVDQKSMQYFIDFAAEMGWEYQLVDWYWYGTPFDPATPLRLAGNPAVSILKQAKEIDIPGLVQYAAKKNVKILVWLDWFHADQEMEQAFPLYEKWGVAGVKVDFMTRDDQEMVNFYHRLVKLAAVHHLTVDFHGAYKPTGIQRTWPNLLTREGVLGNEYNKWSDRVTPEHTVTLAFTRMLAGPMDFTPGGFRHKSVKDFRFVGGDAPGPFVMGTRCRQLAMMVVYESPLQVLCDSPYNYRVSPAGLDLLKTVPTVWDETRVLAGQVGEYIVIARRAGDAWYIGAMTDSNARTLNLPLEFLGAGKYNAHIYNDAPDADEYPERVRTENKIVTNRDSLNTVMVAAGGNVVVLQPLK
jgi:alpha-glucosidase